MEMTFKFRNKIWRLAKEPYCFSLSTQFTDKNGEIGYNVVGYYGELYYLFEKLVKEHFLTGENSKEMLSYMKNTCEELSKAVMGELQAR